MSSLGTVAGMENKAVRDRESNGSQSNRGQSGRIMAVSYTEFSPLFTGSRRIRGKFLWA